MVKLKKAEMIEHECYYCKYYSKSTCSLDHCCLDAIPLDTSSETAFKLNPTSRSLADAMLCICNNFTALAAI